MSSLAMQDFNQKFAQSAELRQKIGRVESVPQLLGLLQEWDISLTGPELMSLAQQSYQMWLAALSATVRSFFVEAHDIKSLNKAIETCNTPGDVVVLAKSHGFQLAEADLQTAAAAAAKIEGFSFEKVWFKSLGLLA